MANAATATGTGAANNAQVSPPLDLVPVEPAGSYPTLPLTANSADVAYVAPGTPAHGVAFLNKGREVLLVWNSTGGALTCTISSVPYRGRSGDVTAYSLGANEYAVFGPFDPAGWNQSTGKVHAVGSAAGVKFAVLKLPASKFAE